jgi:hypothetical protein
VTGLGCALDLRLRDFFESFVCLFPLRVSGYRSDSGLDKLAEHGGIVGSLNDAEHSLPLLLDMILAPFANLFNAEALSGNCTLP